MDAPSPRNLPLFVRCYFTIDFKCFLCYKLYIWQKNLPVLLRRPVTPEVASSSLVGPAMEFKAHCL